MQIKRGDCRSTVRLCNEKKLIGLGLICSGWCWLILYHHPTTTTTTKVPTSSIIGFVCIRDGIELLDVLRLQYYEPQNRRRSPRHASYILGPSEPGAGPGGDRALFPDFGQNVNPICTRGMVTPNMLLIAPLDIQTFLRPCSCDFVIVSPSLTPFGCQVFHLVLIYLLY